MWDFVPWPRIKPEPPALRQRVLITGPSLPLIFLTVTDFIIDISDAVLQDCALIPLLTCSFCNDSSRPPWLGMSVSGRTWDTQDTGPRGHRTQTEDTDRGRKRTVGGTKPARFCWEMAPGWVTGPPAHVLSVCLLSSLSWDLVISFYNRFHSRIAENVLC